MAMTTISSREFNQDTARAKRAARKGPVFITDRGRPAHVLLSIKQYEKLAVKQKSIVEMLAMPGIAEIDFEPPRLGDEYPVPVDLS
jgi:prevent-host-death family protein